FLGPADAGLERLDQVVAADAGVVIALCLGPVPAFPLIGSLEKIRGSLGVHAPHGPRRRVRGKIQQQVAGDDLELSSLFPDTDKLAEEGLILAPGVLTLDRDLEEVETVRHR